MDFLFDHTFQIVALGSGLLGIICGAIGVFAVLRKQSLMGEGIAYSAFPGVILAFLLTQTRQIEVLLTGAVATGLIGTFLIILVTRYSKIKFDTALALTMSVLFGFGMVLVTYAQRNPVARQAGLNRFIFGQAAGILWRDVRLIVIVGLLILIVIVLLWKELKLFSFDPEYAKVLGMPTGLLNLILSLLLVLAIVIGLQTVGVILMSTLIVAPAVASRQWTDDLLRMTILSSIFGMISGVIGTALSSNIPRMPTGPAIVVVATSIAFLSLLLAPNRGLIFARKRRNAKEVST